MKSLYLTVFSVFFFAASAFCASDISADPDFISTGFEYSGTSLIRLGDQFNYRAFRLGGFLEVRNEERFNEIILPNHNWRGVGRLEAIRPAAFFPGTFSVSVKHESAHPTMGIREPTDHAYEMIYDDVYRRFILNSINLKCALKKKFGKFRIQGLVAGNAYFISKNTPELNSKDLGGTGGVSGGICFAVPWKKSRTIFLSVFNRYIAESGKTGRGAIYMNIADTLIQEEQSYPIMNNVNTVAAKTGLTVNRDGWKSITLFFRVLYGNIYGFVDSRDKRLKMALGIEVF